MMHMKMKNNATTSADIYALDIETNKILDIETNSWNVEIYSVQIMHVKEGDRREFDRYVKWYSETKDTGILRNWTDIQKYTGYKPDYIRFTNMIDALAYLTSMSVESPIVVYIHNLAYEGDYICRMLDGEINFISTKIIKKTGEEVQDIFSLDTHKFIRIGINNTITFKCSYILTNKSLASCGIDVGILKGDDYNYDKYHNPNSPLTDDEQNYCYRDVLIVCAKIRQLERTYNLEYKDHTFFPMTSTGFVRNYVRKRCLDDKSYRYHNILNAKLSVRDFLMCECAFLGGDCSAVHTHVGDWIEDVDSFDIGSSYPFQMLANVFPTGKCYREAFRDWKLIQNKIREGKLYILDVTLRDLECNIPYMFLSKSKCLEQDGIVENNGRIYKADEVRIVTTHIELMDIMKAYTPSGIDINYAIYWNSEKLPMPIRKSIIKFYLDKNKLKPIKDLSEDNYINYMSAKEMLNSIYGMMVQNPINDKINFNLSTMEWECEHIPRRDTVKIGEMLEQHYANYNTFLCYQWGVFVTAYARQQLHTAIYGCIENLLYCDTDSLKVKNVDNVKPFIDNFNEKFIKPKLKEISNELDVPLEYILGLGVFDWETKKPEQRYRHFCTLGAKKYAIERYSGEMELTVSGLSKKAINYIPDFNTLKMVFQPGTEFNETTSGRTVSYYIHNTIPKYGDGGVLLLPTTYTLGLSDKYIDFLEEMDKKKLTVTNYVVGDKGIYTRDRNAKDVALSRLETVWSNI